MEENELNESLLPVTEELRKRTFEFLNKNNIKLPIEVENSLSDVFDENDFTSDEDDVINIYFKEDLEDFLTDTMCLKQLNIQVKGGNSSGEILEKYSYYGVLSTENAFSENIGLYDGETLVNQLSLIEPSALNKLENPADFCIVVIEESEFHMGEYTVIPRLYIYIPTSGENIE